MAKIEIPLKKDYAGAFKYWVDTNTENGVCTIPEYICKGIVGMLGKQPVATDTNVGDKISRQAAIDTLKGLEFRQYMEFGEYIGEDTREVCLIRAEKAHDAIQSLPSAQPELKWIPCSERLPEEDHWLGGSGKQFSDNVLVSVYNSDDEDEWVDVSQTIDSEWRIELPRHCKIVAWMPLPEPYKKGGADVQ